MQPAYITSETGFGPFDLSQAMYPSMATSFDTGFNQTDEIAEQFVRQAILAQQAQVLQSALAAPGLLLAQTPSQFVDDSSGARSSTYADLQSTQQTPAARPAAAGKPVREKINGKDFQHFEIDPAKIESGEDTRTTVMLRNMPKSCSREDFQQLLEKCGLKDRITFLYMPFDKRRNGHCGFAFVNFTSAQDVLTMISSMRGGMFKAISRTAAMPPAISFARLQGHDQLLRHFNLSAVMHNGDADKRPLFVNGGTATGGKSGKTKSKQAQKATVAASSLQPAYITPGSDLSPSSYSKIGAGPSYSDKLLYDEWMYAAEGPMAGA